MSARDVLEHLQRLGMSGYEAKAYVALVGAGRPVNGYEVAKRSGVPRSTVYETLGKLVARGAAYELRGSSDATEYLPLPPEALLDRMRREFDGSVAVLRSALPAVAAAPEGHLIHGLKDAEAMLDRAEDVIAGARRGLVMSVWPEEMRRLREAVVDAAERDVEVSVVSFGEDADPFGGGRPGAVYQHKYSAPEAVLEDLGYRLLVVVGDRREAVVGGFGEGAAWGIYTADPAVALMAAEYVRQDIALQILADRVGAGEIDRLFATDPGLLRLLGRARS
ncbi:TrmB family transcriptional regulator [Actinomadura verrucosospora]|uniref:Sugar-specific transcriptional regulator TrmB n=1 Tax=Actinomadura verrucosospora TaxID=46165 RepID=A0A7D4ABD5_ACTVE|nr:TrmB family transcriptional regulator [Actinomadura verrucosospora]QKG26067.1 sugar-specific transcriptional regulator TrmB [Actinomadura verrucosospora]